MTAAGPIFQKIANAITTPTLNSAKVKAAYAQQNSYIVFGKYGHQWAIIPSDALYDSDRVMAVVSPDGSVEYAGSWCGIPKRRTPWYSKRQEHKPAPSR